MKKAHLFIFSILFLLLINIVGAELIVHYYDKDGNEIFPNQKEELLTITVNSPIETEIYKYNKVPLNITTNKLAVCNYSQIWCLPTDDPIMGSGVGIGICLGFYAEIITSEFSTEHFGTNTFYSTTNGGRNEVMFTCTDEENNTIETGRIIVNVTDDDIPPGITIISPEDNSLHNSSSVFVNVYAGETAKWIKASIDDQEPKMECYDCSAAAYDLLNLYEGKHTLTVYASDYFDNIAEKTIEFYVDTFPPRIISQTPADGEKIFGSSSEEFTITYTEENLDKILLFWDETWPYTCGYIDNCPPILLENCNSGEKQTCSINLDLSSYNDGDEIHYYFGVFETRGVSVYLMNPQGEAYSVKIDRCIPDWTEWSEWGECIDEIQTRQREELNHCNPENYLEIQTQSCSIECTPNWNCSEWLNCINGNQTRTCTDLNECGTDEYKPSEIQSCSEECIESWTCTSWSSCRSRKRTRTCTDLNNCGTAVNKPSKEKSCSSSYGSSSSSSSKIVYVTQESDTKEEEIDTEEIPEIISLGSSDSNSISLTGAAIGTNKNNKNPLILISFFGVLSLVGLVILFVKFLK